MPVKVPEPNCSGSADTHKLRIYVQCRRPTLRQPVLDSKRICVLPSSRTSSLRRKPCAPRTLSTPTPPDPCKSNSNWTTRTAKYFPGAYAEVHFKLPASGESLRLPANTVLFRAAGLQVATLDGQKRVKLKSIVQGRDFGTTIEILSGLEPDEVVILNPPDSLTDGVLVRISSPPRPSEGQE